MREQEANAVPDADGFIRVSVEESLVEACVSAVQDEDDPWALGVVLGLDVGLDLPRFVIAATYERLFALGIRDVLTRMLYARYLALMWGPDRDDEADAILAEVLPIAEMAGFLDPKAGFGHHPVFYAGRDRHYDAQPS